VLHRPAAHLASRGRYSEIHDDTAAAGAFYRLVSSRIEAGRRLDDAFIPCLRSPIREPHAGTICGILRRQIGETPSLLTHREVETIFHGSVTCCTWF